MRDTCVSTFVHARHPMIGCVCYWWTLPTHGDLSAKPIKVKAPYPAPPNTFSARILLRLCGRRQHRERLLQSSRHPDQEPLWGIGCIQMCVTTAHVPTNHIHVPINENLYTTDKDSYWCEDEIIEDIQNGTFCGYTADKMYSCEGKNSNA